MRFVRSLGFELLKPIIRCWENQFFSVDERNATPPIFIVGAPRTGSTILYQSLSNAYKFAYIDNAACIWHRNLRFGLWLSHKRYGDKPHNNFKSEHGDTKVYGDFAPSECGEFWYRWLPKDRHFIDYADITPKMVSAIRQEVLGTSTYLQRPMLFKNLNAGQRLRLIHKAFPNAKIIFVRRDPRFVARSILKARNRVGLTEGQWWSVMPPNVEELKKLPESEMCMAQVFYIERQIEEDLMLFSKENVYEIHYQNFDKALIERLAQWCGVSPRDGGEMPNFKHDDIGRLQPEEAEKLTRLMDKYPFKKEVFV